MASLRRWEYLADSSTTIPPPPPPAEFLFKSYRTGAGGLNLHTTYLQQYLTPVYLGLTMAVCDTWPAGLCVKPRRTADKSQQFILCIYYLCLRTKLSVEVECNRISNLCSLLLSLKFKSLKIKAGLRRKRVRKKAP
jgi:hypothetical protein